MTDDESSFGPGARPPVRSPYAPRPGVFDEAADEQGGVRPHWQRLLGWMEEVGAPELQRQEALALKRISEDGVAYHVHDDPVGAARPWPLDMAPLVLSAAEWTALDDGLRQRATVLELLLADLHGAQRTVREGVVPAELVYGVPYFLRACQGEAAARGPLLNLYACDAIRTAGGQWRVLADRTQAPAGIGFALENRVVSARMLAEPFAADHVQRLAHFFLAVRQALAALDPRQQDHPRVVLLTPGPGNETYFENAYLAHYLGYTLVEAEDLVVRDDGVHLKMLGGLKRVDVLLRRIDDVFCDPVELRADSQVGVPGLVGAVRRGQVAVANALGAGLLATPALMSYLPAACRHFLGQDLRLSAVDGFWCGAPGRLAQVLADPDPFALYEVAGPQPNLPWVPARLAAAERQDLLARVRAAPGRFVVQVLPPLATLPQLENRRIEPCHAILRAFLVNRGSDFQAMPGGLVRTVGADYADELPVYAGRSSKDAWVMSDQPVDKFSLLTPASATIPVSRGGGDLASRVADHLFWLGRYKERLEGSVRVLRVLFLRVLDQGDEVAAGSSGVLQRLVQVYPVTGTSLQPLDWPANQLDPRVTGSVRSLLDVIQRNAGRVRDRFSGDTWRVLNRLFVDLPTSSGDPWALLPQMVDWFNVTIIRLSSFDGMTMESMTRGPGWRFLDLGRRIERVLHMASLAGHAFDESATGPVDLSACENVLSIADNLITYRRRYLTQLQPAPMLDLLLADESNPRSVAFQLERMREHLGCLPGVRTEPLELGAARLEELSDLLARAEMLQVAPDGSPGRVLALHDLLERFELAMPELSDLLTARYFSHSEASRSLATFARTGTA